MHNDDSVELRARINSLEGRVRRQSAIGYAFLVLAIVPGGILPTLNGQRETPQNLIRARAIVLVDDHGRDRIIIGAPVPNLKEGQRISASTGLVINDPDGYERFGFGLQESGNMVMGFDAPRGTGDERNRERINIVADKGGSAFIVFKNRRTEGSAILQLDARDKFSFDFMKFTSDKILRRRLDFEGDRTLNEPR